MRGKLEGKELIASMLLLVGEFTVLTLSLVVPWKVDVILYVGGVIVQQVGGVSTYAFFCGFPPPAIMMLMFAYEGVKSPLTWFLVPLYMGIKPILLNRTRLGEVRAVNFMPLVYLVERYLTFPWFSSLASPTILPQGGFGIYCLLFGLLLGAFSTNYFSSSLLRKIVEALSVNLGEKQSVPIKELAGATGYSERVIYALLSEAVTQGVLGIVVTPEKVCRIDSEDGRRAVAAVFNEALSRHGKVKISRVKWLMKKYNVYFTRSEEILLRFLSEAIKRGDVKGEIDGRWIRKAVV
ncbi:MAG: hypothetical protein QXW47_02845 [Candidatus Jordarchaeales archaeon]